MRDYEGWLQLGKILRFIESAYMKQDPYMQDARILCILDNQQIKSTILENKTQFLIKPNDEFQQYEILREAN